MTLHPKLDMFHFDFEHAPVLLKRYSGILNSAAISICCIWNGLDADKLRIFTGKCWSNVLGMKTVKPTAGWTNDTARYQHLFFTFTFESPPTVNLFSQNGTCHLYSFLFMTSSTVTGYTGIRTARPSNCPARYDTPRSRNDEENVAVELDVPSIGKTPRGFVWKFWRNEPASNCYSLAVQVLSLYILKCG